LTTGSGASGSNRGRSPLRGKVVSKVSIYANDEFENTAGEKGLTSVPSQAERGRGSKGTKGSRGGRESRGRRGGKVGRGAAISSTSNVEVNAHREANAPIRGTYQGRERGPKRRGDTAMIDGSLLEL